MRVEVVATIFSKCTGECFGLVKVLPQQQHNATKDNNNTTPAATPPPTAAVLAVLSPPEEVSFISEMAMIDSYFVNYNMRTHK